MVLILLLMSLLLAIEPENSYDDVVTNRNLRFIRYFASRRASSKSLLKRGVILQAKSASFGPFSQAVVSKTSFRETKGIQKAENERENNGFLWPAMSEHEILENLLG